MEDMLSSLPQELLCHILSFLPTKQAVATSVLSKRWMPLWRLVPALDFDDSDYYHIHSIEDYDRLVLAMHATLLSRDVHHPIHKFSLSCHSRFYSPANVKVWVNAAVRLRVQRLELSIIYHWHLKQHTNLSAIFTCSTLVVLKLERLALQRLSAVDLPLLKVLHLEVIVSKNSCLALLLSGCPVLEDFTATSIIFYNRSTDKDKELKTLPKLVRADVSVSCAGFLLKEVVSNVKFLRIQEMGDMCIAGPKVFPMFHNLAHIELVYGSHAYDWWQLLRFLQHCPKLQVLVINQTISAGCEFDGVEDAGNWPDPKSVPECILLHLNRCYLMGYRGIKGEFQFARYILQNGKSLKTMTIRSDVTANQELKLKMLDKLSSCPRSSTTCKLSFK